MAHRLNILVSSYCADQSDVGEVQMAYLWLKHLGQHCNVTVLSIGSRIAEQCGLETCPGVELIQLKPRVSFKWWDTFDRIVHPSYVEYFWKARKVAQSIVKRQEIDLCHHLSPFSLRYPSPLLWTGKPLVVGPIYGGLRSPDVLREMAVREGALMKLRALDAWRMKWDPWLKRHFRQADRYVVSAPYVKNLLPSTCGDKTRIVSGVAVDRYPSPSRGEDSGTKIQMIAVARLVPIKGIEILLHALSQCKSREKIDMHIYGQGPDRASYEQLSGTLGLSDTVIWHGFAAHGEVLERYREMDVFVLPSLKEPAGIAVLEAMSAGLPVICVDAGGPAYTVADSCGIKVPLGNKDSIIKGLTDALDQMVENRAERLAMGVAAQQRIEESFTWEAVVAQMLSVYQQVV